MSEFANALFAIDGTISARAYWLAWLLMTAVACLILHVLTRGWCWDESYGAEGASARNLAIAIAAASLATAYPVFALVVKALNTTGGAGFWALLILIPSIVQPFSQWFGLNGSFAKPTQFGMALSVAYLIGVVAIGIGL